jgi:hypothetical protein
MPLNYFALLSCNQYDSKLKIVPWMDGDESEVPGLLNV